MSRFHFVCTVCKVVWHTDRPLRACLFCWSRLRLPSALLDGDGHHNPICAHD